ncbi:MAG: helix-turn-helix domain-containing protein [Chloroflexi bacterium]|nr:helix-turn-helix domain-containing protein [Chloroflexota bacterium]
MPERLLAARERKGVDLYRAERDTKIRSRYLAALERGDYRELPGPVYTKGFLRNYALYLGLDPDDVLLHWRRERGGGREPRPVITVPRPLATPRPGPRFSRRLLVFALLTVVVLAFGAYVAVQLLRFAKPPTIAVTDPAVAVVEVGDSVSQYVLRGTSTAGATINIATPGRDPYSVSADDQGRWTAIVDLRRGRNQFELRALDPQTGKPSEGSVALFITVPVLVTEPPTLSVEQPVQGATFENGAIPVQGKATNATSVIARAVYAGPTTVSSGPASPAPTPGPPAPVSAAVSEDGGYLAQLKLPPGRWTITVTTVGPGRGAATLTRNVTVALEGVTLGVSMTGGKAWLKVWVDGKFSALTGTAGRVFAAGKRLTFTALHDIEVRTGNAAATSFTLNGVDIGRLSKESNSATWRFAPPAPPLRLDRP